MDDKAFLPEEVGIDGKLLIPVGDNEAGGLTVPSANAVARARKR